MASTKDMQALLHQASVINSKYRAAQQDPKYQFNIFTILRQIDDEVSLHSRFLAAILDPQGQHLQGDTFLALFLDQVGIEGLDSENATVRREYRNIDILIVDARHAVIIENKINAGDRPLQLERYNEIIRQEGYKKIDVIYLTLYGDPPSRQSIGSLNRDAIQLVSYADDIHAWLDECIGRTKRVPAVSEVLYQYQRVIERLTGQSMSKEYIMEITELLLDDKNIELATHLSQALEKARIEVQWRFWRELEKQLVESGFQMLQGKECYASYSREKVERYPKRGNRHYGLMIKLADYDANTELVFYVKVGWGVYYGISAIRDGNRKVAQDPEFDKLARILQEIDPGLERTPYSIGMKATSPRIGFRRFNDAETFAMADPVKRSAFIKELAREIQAMSAKFLELYDELKAIK